MKVAPTNSIYLMENFHAETGPAAPSPSHRRPSPARQWLKAFVPNPAPLPCSLAHGAAANPGPVAPREVVARAVHWLLPPVVCGTHLLRPVDRSPPGLCPSATLRPPDWPPRRRATRSAQTAMYGQAMPTNPPCRRPGRTSTTSTAPQCPGHWPRRAAAPARNAPLAQSATPTTPTSRFYLSWT
jgi:hypothetical protein